MASLLSEMLFNSKTNRRNEAPCNASPRTRFQTLFGAARAQQDSDANDAPPIHSGPTERWSEFSDKIEATDRFPTTLSAMPAAFVSDGGLVTRRLKVVKENDGHRGFRMFDGMLLSVKDVSSEELFLERMKLAYSAYETFVAHLVDHSPLEITNGLVRAVSACLENYFSTQSMLRTNRPSIVKVLNLQNPDMFCAHSDLMKSFLFTNASPEDEAVISNAEAVFSETGGAGVRLASRPQHNNDGSTEHDRFFEEIIGLAEARLAGGSRASLGSAVPPAAASSNLSLSNELLFQQRKDGAGRTLVGGTTAMLVVITDVEALHNFVAYMLYLTPAQLTRRYTVNFDSLLQQRPTSSILLDTCRARRAASKRRRNDDAKVSIRTVLERKLREKVDVAAERGALHDAGMHNRNQHMVQRNGDLLRHLLLMLFDKCLSGLIDKGFENLNTSRGYAVNSAKEIGAATIYTGIIDTVGEVSSRVEGYTFDSVVKSPAAAAASAPHTGWEGDGSFSRPSVPDVTGGGGGNKQRRWTRGDENDGSVGTAAETGSGEH